MLFKKRSHCSEKPSTASKERPLLTATRGSPPQQQDPRQPKINNFLKEIKFFLIKWERNKRRWCNRGGAGGQTGRARAGPGPSALSSRWLGLSQSPPPPTSCPKAAPSEGATFPPPAEQEERTGLTRYPQGTATPAHVAWSSPPPAVRCRNLRLRKVG